MREKECPISEKYSLRLLHLEERYSKKGIKFIYNYVGQIKPEENAREDLRKFSFKGSYVVDWKHNIINALGAKTTKEVFVLNSDRRVVYRGPVDAQYRLLGKILRAKNFYLIEVLENILLNQKIKLRMVPVSGCVISRPVLSGNISYKDVAPIIKRKCTVCHNPLGTAPINFISYKDIIGRGDMFKYVIEKDLMPPWWVDPGTGPWKGDLSLSKKEKAMLIKWSKSGFSKIGKTDLLWRKKTSIDRPKPDYVLNLPDKVIIPSEGPAIYKYFLIKNPFKKDRWIKGVNLFYKRKIVHHMKIFIMGPSYKLGKDPRTNNPLGVLAPFKIDESMESNYVMKIPRNGGIKMPKNSRLLFEIHYEPIGTEIIDNYTKAHIYFHDKKPEYGVTFFYFFKMNLNIPPLMAHHKVKGTFKVKEDMYVFSTHFHMHLRGKANEIWVVNPKGIRKRVFGIDPFIKNFETSHTFKKPVFISKDSIVECVAWFDNSKGNVQNPDPTKKVTWGPTLEDEMFICSFKLLSPINQSIKTHYIFER